MSAIELTPQEAMLLRRVLGWYISDTTSNAGAKRAEVILAKLTGTAADEPAPEPNFPSTWPWKPKSKEARR